MQACKANDGNEEDVDIGGDELPISRFPPVEIERDTVVRNSKSSSSSSSSSGSESASSESDSGSSSGSESDDAKASTIVNNAKDTMGTEVNMEQTPIPHDAKVIFDADSSGSRVHVFCFDKNLDLVHIGKELELFEQLKPGLSAHASDPKAAADSLLPLLQKAETVVPKDMRQNTPVKVGATAGLRQLGVDASERILQSVKDFLKVKSNLKSNDDWVTVLDGTQEGAYQWVTINYLLKKFGQKYSHTVGVVDLGGGSVQMAYAISEADAAKAPRISNGEDTYVKEDTLLFCTFFFLRLVMAS